MRIPTYKRQADAPAATGIGALGLQMPLTDPVNQGIREVSDAVGHMSDLAEKRFEQRRKEQQAIGVADAISRLRKFESEKVISLFGLTGKDAVGDVNDPDTFPSVYKQGTELYDEERNRIAGEIQDPEIAAAFQLRAGTVIDTGLEQLARHEAKEHQVLKQNQYEATYANLVQSVSMNWSNSEAIESAVDEIKRLADDTFPGLDMSATKLQAESGLRAVAIKRMADVSPETALNHLRAWKDKFTPEVYDQLKTPVESEALFEQVRMNNPGHFDAMDDAAQASGFDQRVKNTVSGWVRAAEAEQKRRDAEALKQRRVDGYNNVWSLVRQGNLTQAMKTAGGLNTNDFTQGEIHQLEEYIRQGTVKNNSILEKSLHMQIRMGEIDDMHQLYRMPEMQQLSVEALGRLEKLIEDEKKQPSNYGTAISSLEQRFDRVYKDTEFYSLKPLFTSELLDDIQREEQVKGRRLTTQEILAVGNAMLDLKEQEIDWWFNSSTRDFTERAEAYQEGVAKGNKAQQEPSVTSKWVDEIDPGIRNNIITAIQQGGRQPFVDDVWKMFQHYHPEDSRRIMEATPQ